MTLGYWYMLGALLSFAGMGVAHKMGDRLKCQPRAIALITMVAGFAVTLLRASLTHGPGLGSTPLRVALLAIPFGISSALALWLFQNGLRHGHIVTSWLVINLSTAIPTALSIIVYRETLNARKLLTLALICVSLVLLWWDRKQSAARAARSV